MTRVFSAVVSDDGQRLIFDQREEPLRRGHLRTLAGKPVLVTVGPYRRGRSLEQNKWWWGVAIPILANELGYDKHEHEDLHYALVAECFGVHRDERMKREVPNKRSSSLSTVEFSELMDWAVRWAASTFGIQIPLPNEVII